MKTNKLLIAYSVAATVVAGVAGITCFKLTDKVEDQQFIIENLNTIVDLKQDHLNDYASKKITIDILDKQIEDAQDRLEALKNETDESN